MREGRNAELDLDEKTFLQMAKLNLLTSYCKNWTNSLITLVGRAADPLRLEGRRNTHMHHAKFSAKRVVAKEVQRLLKTCDRAEYADCRRFSAILFLYSINELSGLVALTMSSSCIISVGGSCSNRVKNS